VDGIRAFIAKLFASEFALNVLAGVAAAGVCTLIGLVAYRVALWWRDRRLKGEWEAWWQPFNPGDTRWVGQKMRIHAGIRKLKLASVPGGRIDYAARRNRERQYEWDGEMELHDRLYLYGSWHTRGGPGCGAFVLMRANNNELLCGYIIGDNQGNDVKMGPFVLGKDRRSVLTGMRWMQKNWREFEPPEEIKEKLNVE
jgi:hypothetical protein